MRLWTVVMLFTLISCALQKGALNPWEMVREPSPGEAKSIGSYSGGCLAGGISLPPSGEGYQFMALSRGRYYGHPKTLAYIERLGQNVLHKFKQSLAVGDISMPRGGLFSNGAHGSHQNGLDVDFWFVLLPPKVLALHQRDTWPLEVVVDQPDGVDRQLNIHWTLDGEELIKMAARDEEVERIFVNPAIKKFFCQKYPGKDGEEWARRIRAWWGHHEHLHVLVKCPDYCPDCKAQTPIEDDGCQEVEWWWSQDYVKSTEEREASKKEIGDAPQILDACKFLL